MSEEERLNKRQKIEQNRAKKRAAICTEDDPSLTTPKRIRSSPKSSHSNSEWNRSSGILTLL